jgi:RES domain-containing protein
VLVWRLTPPAYARVLDGRGNRETGARWNSPGRGVVYASFNLSLCVLETYVHIPPALRLSLPEFEAARIEIPDNAGVTEISPATLARAMATPDPAAACRAIGDQWLSRGDDLILAAPSTIVAEEMNVMINPAHPRMRDVRVTATRRFQFDPRLT